MLNNIDLWKNEERRIIHGPDENEKIGGWGTNRFIIYCNGDAPLVLERSKEVLLKVNQILQTRLPDISEWYSILPDYFVYRCRPKMSHEQSKKEVELERKIRTVMTPADHGVLSNMIPWELSSWTHWFQNEERYWYWWDSYVHEDSHIFVAVEIHEWPYPSGNLSWLFRGCGACFVEPEPEGVND